MLWLHQIDDAPDFAAIGAEVEKNRNILRDERGGLPVCETLVASGRSMA
ncbi:MAG: hypothetical protein IPJ48_15140 [Propionivibrio sp.]|uniref:Uncharacterized protein n=1 Tax=Candidatus Propionivibrio dominans TaxID=2954373 RepID=A0A9D7F8X9_9RHOO|nr:hypothetical protein [Candidatus Propionivibrio dominans]